MDEQEVTSLDVEKSINPAQEGEQLLTVETETNSVLQARTLPKGTQNDENSTQYYLKGFRFLLLLILALAIIGPIYMLSHGINALELLRYPDKTWGFAYLGGNANPSSIGIEILVWSFIGVTCQLAYLAGRAILRSQFHFWRYVIRWISAAIYAWGIAVAVIFTLTIITLDIGGIEITLANASIETIIAIAFILGFYNNESRKLLDKLRGQIAIGMENKSETQKNEKETS